MAYTKPFLTIAQQIALLQGRKMIISDVPRASSYLERIGYYRLSGYWYPFRESAVQPGTPPTTIIFDDFKASTDFKTIVELYVFDKKLRMLLLDGIERFEIALRVQIALLLGARDPWAHRDPNQLDGTFSRRTDPKTGVVLHQDWLRRTDEAFDRSKEEFAKHFRFKYPGVPPIWVACELWDFGALSFLFSGLTKPDQAAIARNYGISSFKVMEGWIRAIGLARNICAHHCRLWNRPIGFQPRWPTQSEAPDLAHLLGDVTAQTRVYGTAAIIRFLLRSINPTTAWSSRFKALCTEFPTSTVAKLGSAGFPQNWQTEALWA